MLVDRKATRSGVEGLIGESTMGGVQGRREAGGTYKWLCPGLIRTRGHLVTLLRTETISSGHDAVYHGPSNAL